jgi:hypothetical protein
VGWIASALVFTLSVQDVAGVSKGFKAGIAKVLEG